MIRNARPGCRRGIDAYGKLTNYQRGKVSHTGENQGTRNGLLRDDKNASLTSPQDTRGRFINRNHPEDQPGRRSYAVTRGEDSVRVTQEHRRRSDESLDLMENTRERGHIGRKCSKIEWCEPENRWPGDVYAFALDIRRRVGLENGVEKSLGSNR